MLSRPHDLGDFYDFLIALKVWKIIIYTVVQTLGHIPICIYAVRIVNSCCTIKFFFASRFQYVKR